VLNDFDIWAEAGHDVALKKTFNVEVQGGVLEIEFPEVKGRPGYYIGHRYRQPWTRA
jgi:hypothetical protein